MELLTYLLDQWWFYLVLVLLLTILIFWDGPLVADDPHDTTEGEAPLEEQQIIREIAQEQQLAKEKLAFDLARMKAVINKTKE